MSKPRAKATTTGRVEKKKAAPKKKTSVGDKVKGLVEKAEGKVERKPAKKVCVYTFRSGGRRARRWKCRSMCICGV